MWFPGPRAPRCVRIDLARDQFRRFLAELDRKEGSRRRRDHMTPTSLRPFDMTAVSSPAAGRAGDQTGSRGQNDQPERRRVWDPGTGPHLRRTTAALHDDARAEPRPDVVAGFSKPAVPIGSSGLPRPKDHPLRAGLRRCHADDWLVQVLTGHRAVERGAEGIHAAVGTNQPVAVACRCRCHAHDRGIQGLPDHRT